MVPIVGQRRPRRGATEQSGERQGHEAGAEDAGWLLIVKQA